MNLEELVLLRDTLVFDRDGWQQVLAKASGEQMRKRARDGEHCNRHLATVRAELWCRQVLATDKPRGAEA